MVQANAINYYSPARWVVSKTAGEGTHTTIAGALLDASSGETIFVMSGTYTEDLTLVPGVNINALDGNNLTDTPNTTILGKCTLSGAGDVAISGIQLQTNSDFFLAVTGSAASLVFLTNCFLNCSDNTGITFTSSNAASRIQFQDCQGEILTTGITFFVSTASGNMSGDNVSIQNIGNTVTPSSSSTGGVSFTNSGFTMPFDITGAASISFFRTSISNSPTDTTCITGSGTGSSVFSPKVTLGRVFLDSKGAANGAVNIATGNHVSMRGDCDIRTDGANAITGDGTLLYTPISFSTTTSTSITTETPLPIGPEISVISNILTIGDRVSDLGSATNSWDNLYVDGISFNDGADFLDDYEEGTFTPTLIGTTGSIGAQTYGEQTGQYIKIGNQVTLWGIVTLTNKGSWTGVATLAGLPFTGAAGFTGGRQFVDGRNLTVSGAGSYLTTNDGSVASSTSVGLEAAGSGGSGSGQLYSDIANDPTILYTFIYQE